MKVFTPTPLRSYTRHEAEVEGHGSTIAEMLEDLDQRFAGIRFRMIDEQDAIRPHMWVFINGEAVHRLDARLGASDEIQILQALSGATVLIVKGSLYVRR